MPPIPDHTPASRNNATTVVHRVFGKVVEAISPVVVGRAVFDGHGPSGVHPSPAVWVRDDIQDGRRRVERIANLCVPGHSLGTEGVASDDDLLHVWEKGAVVEELHELI